jgi:hypothetical protein
MEVEVTTVDTKLAAGAGPCPRCPAREGWTVRAAIAAAKLTASTSLHMGLVRTADI